MMMQYTEVVFYRTSYEYGQRRWLNIAFETSSIVLLERQNLGSSLFRNRNDVRSWIGSDVTAAR